MATWNVGPFDNDEAVEWCARLESTPADGRAALLERALFRVVSDAIVSETIALEAVAAASTVLQCLTGRQASSAEGPRFLLGRNGITVTPDLRALAVSALDAILIEGSAWRSRWAGDIEEEEALDAVAELRSELANPTSSQA